MPQRRPDVSATFLDPRMLPAEPAAVVRRSAVPWQPCLLVALVAAVYAMTLTGEFAYLDDRIVADNVVLKSWRGLAAIWMHPSVSPQYRPLAHSLLLVQFQVFGSRNPGGYLAVNALLHAGAVVLFWLVLRRCSPAGTLLAASIVAVHPINVAAVAWISQQPLLLGSVLSLGSLLAWLRGFDCSDPERAERQNRILALAGALHVAAMLCHPVAVALPAVALLLCWWRSPTTTRRAARFLALPMVLSACWLGLTLWLDARRVASVGGVNANHLKSLLMTGPASLRCVSHLFAPVGLAFVYPRWTIGQTSDALPLVVSSLLLAVLVLTGILAGRIGRGVFVTLAAFVLTLLPMLLAGNELRPISDFSDHLAYAPTLAIVAALCIGVSSLLRSCAARLAIRSPIVAQLSGALLVVLIAAAAMSRVRDYRSPDRLWMSCLRINPDFAAAHTQLGLIQLTARRDLSQAMAHFRKAMQSDPNDPQTLTCVGEALELQGQPAEAIMRYHQALAIAPRNAEARFGLARALAQQGNSQEAIQQYRLLLEAQPNHALAYNNLGLLHSERGELVEAKRAYSKAIAIKPDLWMAHINLANLQFARGELDDAATTLMRVVDADPRNFEAWLNAGAMTGELAARARDSTRRDQFLEQSISCLERATALRPESAAANHNLGVALLQQGNVDTACRYLQKAVDLEPTNLTYQRSLTIGRSRVPTSPR